MNAADTHVVYCVREKNKIVDEYKRSDQSYQTSVYAKPRLVACGHDFESCIIVDSPEQRLLQDFMYVFFYFDHRKMYRYLVLFFLGF